MFADSFDPRHLCFPLGLKVKRQVIAGTVGKFAGEKVMQAFRHNICGEKINLRFAVCKSEINATDKAAIRRNGIFPW